MNVNSPSPQHCPAASLLGVSNKMGCASTLAHEASTQSRQACISILKRKEYQYRLPCPSCRVCCRMDGRQLREYKLPSLPRQQRGLSSRCVRRYLVPCLLSAGVYQPALY